MTMYYITNKETVITIEVTQAGGGFPVGERDFNKNITTTDTQGDYVNVRDTNTIYKLDYNLVSEPKVDNAKQLKKILDGYIVESDPDIKHKRRVEQTLANIQEQLSSVTELLKQMY